MVLRMLRVLMVLRLLVLRMLLVLLMMRVLLRGSVARRRHGQRLEAQPADVAEVGGRGVVP
ncbi:hypothetical protein GCM10009603_42320 [Nocardiopsis exhalans]